MNYATFLFIFLCTVLAPLHAQEDPAHAQLRSLRDQFLRAVASNDLEGQIACLHPNVIVTWHNAEVSRGHAGVRDYLARMLTGPEARVKKFSAKVTVDELSVLYGGDTALAFGSAEESFTLANNRPLEFVGRWSAAMVKEGDRWLIANLHTSENMFSNPLLESLKRGMVWAGVFSLAVGLTFGYLFGRRRRA